MLFSSAKEVTKERLQLLERFAGVFEQTYTRFLDLQKAEAQAREAQIEAALERVRSRTMAMFKSEELNEVVFELFNQMKPLGFANWGCTLMLADETNEGFNQWLSSPTDRIPTECFHVPKVDHPVFDKFLSVYTNQIPQHTIEIKDREKYKWDLLWFEKTDFKNTPQSVKESILASTKVVFSTVSLRYGLMIAIDEDPIPDKMINILSRFAKVFEQTYTRFLDLQNSEAQSRESQIQLAMERVRARTMAMQRSDELGDASLLLFQQVGALGLPPFACGFNIWDEDRKAATAWMGSVGGLQPPFKTDSSKDVYLPIYDATQRGESLFVKEQSGKELEVHYDYLATIPTFRDIILEGWKQTGISVPTFQIIHCAFFSQDYLMFITYEPVTAAYDIFKRFAKVFEQTYTRFLDLQKAEAQAREAQIETALERVRSRTMAMQRSEELTETAGLIFQQINELGIQQWGNAFQLFDDDMQAVTSWTCTKGMEIQKFKIPATVDPIMINIVKAAKKKEKLYVEQMEGIALENHYKYMTSLPVIKEAFEKLAEAGFTPPKFQIFHAAYFSYGYILFITHKPYPETYDIFKRFANVFEQTYTRFLDLQKAEAQAREAQIETALERVRSRTLAMQKSDELAETATVLFQQLISLGIEPNRLYITIIKDEEANAEFWITDEDGSKVSSAFDINMNNNHVFKKMLNGWKEKRTSLAIDMKGEELQEYFQYLSSLYVPFKGGLTQTRRIQYIGYFNKGFIGMASPDDQPEETVQLLVRFAAVFNLTFTRFNDLKIAEAHALQAEEDLIKLQTEKKRAEEALAELQLTQKQLIQSEKMASLGELTAGIAHEIQNPLNFVNNFSEVNLELIEEVISEKSKVNSERDEKLEDELLNDIAQNLKKINHHGKRADAIVKGMLQHSRSSNGVKEPTDINALVDEYLRLSYHGLRAKDKSFNATMITDYDDSIGKVNVIPQDLGRVILNLITNAFYAVTEKKKQSVDGYEPTVTVATHLSFSSNNPLIRQSANSIIISVKDNGNGIPPKVLDKIFQPFFTTKPTGQGTGLGLSMSYDIVTKGHGGELLVTTEEGLYTEFRIVLPI